MRLQIIILVFGCLVFILFSGCETVRSLRYIGEGIQRDLKNTKDNIIEIDQWFREHAW